VANRDVWLREMGGLRRWVVRLVTRACMLRQLSGFESRHLSKIQKWASYAKEWPTHSSLQKERRKSKSGITLVSWF
jgi:hypothetical protein